MTTLSFADWNDAQEYFFANGLTDGLPVVPPTPDRVQAMLDYAGVDAAHDLGTEIIRQKRFTAGKAAVNAVMAGCLPEHFPVVMASLPSFAQAPQNLASFLPSTPVGSVAKLTAQREFPCILSTWALSINRLTVAGRETLTFGQRVLSVVSADVERRIVACKANGRGDVLQGNHLAQVCHV